MSFQRLVAAASLVTLLGNIGCGGTVMMKPPPPPKPSLPVVEEVPEPPPGFSRVLISSDVPARVYEGPTLLCDSTPCVAMLPYGDHELHFEGAGKRDRERASNAVARVSHSTEVVNHTLGKDPPNTGAFVGYVVLLLGAIVVGAGFAMAENGPRSGGKINNGAKVTLGVGLATSFLGTTLYLASPKYLQEGSTTQWTPTPRTSSIGAGIRF